MLVYGVSWCVSLEEYAFSISSPSKTEVKAEGVLHNESPGIYNLSIDS
jgi:hypothetical protein